MPLWAHFTRLEDIRNDIIHQKTTAAEQQDSSFMAKLLQPEIFDIVTSGLQMIEYFCKAAATHAYFPLGFGEARVKPIVVENFEEMLTKVID